MTIPMDPIGGILGTSGPPVASSLPGARAWLRLRQSGRSGRVILLVLMIAMLNAFDLAFTILAQRIGGFHEVNPLARMMLGNPSVLIVFKLSAALLASSVFIIYRRHWLTELACWAFAMVYTVLSLMWTTYYNYLSRV